MKRALMICAVGLASRVCSADWFAVSLHPDGMASASSGLAADGTLQGGYAWMGQPDTINRYYPVLWEGSSGSMRNLLPQGTDFETGWVYGMHGGRQVGRLGGMMGSRAVVWEGTAESYRVLPYNPNRYLGTEALAISGNQVVGVGYDANVGGRRRAAVWDLAAWTSRDLAPAGSHDSFAVGTDGSSQVGRVLFSSGGFRAAMWRGTPGSYVDLQPEGYIDGSAMGVAGNVQVGSVLLAEVGYRAALWRGSASSFVDLTPEGSIAAEVYATTGALHVGFVRGADGYGGATLWLGDDAGSAVNLHGFLGSEYWESVASAISVSSDGTVRISGRAMRQGYTREQAVVWVITSIPTPATLAVVSAGVLAMGRRRRRY
jgi:hypothetical protein